MVNNRSSYSGRVEIYPVESQSYYKWEVRVIQAVQRCIKQKIIVILIQVESKSYSCRVDMYPVTSREEELLQLDRQSYSGRVDMYPVESQSYSGKVEMY